MFVRELVMRCKSRKRHQFHDYVIVCVPGQARELRLQGGCEKEEAIGKVLIRGHFEVPSSIVAIA